MTPDQFRAALADLGLSQVGFARLAMVDARTVRRWCDGTRAVPGPVVALLRVMMAKDEWREIPITQWQRVSPKEL
jgi:DNA-binding transcriptional regulator YiaG